MEDHDDEQFLHLLGVMRKLLTLYAVLTVIACFNEFIL